VKQEISKKIGDLDFEETDLQIKKSIFESPNY